MSADRMIADIKRKARANGIKVLLSKKERITDGTCNPWIGGYFSSEEKSLVVSNEKDKDIWLQLLAHESAHMDQWIENKYLWDKHTIGYDLFFSWLSDRSIIMKAETLFECVQDIIRIEKDCEFRTIKKLKKYNIPVDLKVYIKKANTCLYSYLFMLTTRKWQDEVYKQNVWTHAPGHFKKEYKIIPRRLLAAFKRFEKQIANKENGRDCPD